MTKKRPDKTRIIPKKGGFDITFSKEDGEKLAGSLNEGKSLCEALFFAPQEPMTTEPIRTGFVQEELYEKTFDAILHFTESDDPIWCIDDIRDACEHALKGRPDFLRKWDVKI